MNADEAIRAWGLKRLKKAYPRLNFYEDVHVSIEMNEGFSCCGGRDPDCYCSYAESPSCNVVIEGKTVGPRSKTCTVDISHYEFDFVSVLEEILEASE